MLSLCIRSLRDVSYLDKPSGGVERLQEEGVLRLAGEIDRVYMNTPADVGVTGITSGAGLTDGKVFTSLTVHRSATVRQAPPALSNVVAHAPLDVVVWNPGPERAKAIADLGDDDWR